MSNPISYVCIRGPGDFQQIFVRAATQQWATKGSQRIPIMDLCLMINVSLLFWLFVLG
jgi:hypothetical protein